MKTSSGATAVQIVYSSHRGSRDIDHLGSAHSGAEVELNIFLGWTFIGWVVALAMAVSGPGRSKLPKIYPQPPAPWR